MFFSLATGALSNVKITELRLAPAEVGVQVVQDPPRAINPSNAVIFVIFVLGFFAPLAADYTGDPLVSPISCYRLNYNHADSAAKFCALAATSCLIIPWFVPGIITECCGCLGDCWTATKSRSVNRMSTDKVGCNGCSFGWW